MPEPIVSGLYYYPIKSCAGIPLEEAVLTERGIVHDREFMLIDSQTKKFIRQLNHARLALVKSSVDTFSLSVAAPDADSITVPILKQGKTIDNAVVWNDACGVIDQGDQIAEWFSSYLSRECRLVRMAEDFIRKVSPKYATNPQDQVGFADGYPLLIISQESLDDLNKRMRKNNSTVVPMDRFRPNIVLSGSGLPYFEDTVQRLYIGTIPVDVVKPCVRCGITCIDQETSERGKEPLRTLLTYRPLKEGSPLFGQNAIHILSGRIRLKDKVEVLAYK